MRVEKKKSDESCATGTFKKQKLDAVPPSTMPALVGTCRECQERQRLVPVA